MKRSLVKLSTFVRAVTKTVTDRLRNDPLRTIKVAKSDKTGLTPMTSRSQNGKTFPNQSTEFRLMNFKVVKLFSKFCCFSFDRCAFIIAGPIFNITDLSVVNMDSYL